MRSFFAIVFTVLILLNVMGYYGVFLGLQYQNTREVTSRLDNDQYAENEAITLKIPLSLPYPVEQTGYERVDGEVQHEGRFYRLVKQKLANDTLYMVCIPDHKHEQITEALNDYVKTFADHPVRNNNQTKSSFEFIKDYLPAGIVITSVNPGWSHAILYGEGHPSWPLLFLPIASPPPRI